MRKFILEMLPFVALFGMLMFASCKAKNSILEMPIVEVSDNIDGLEVAYFADACYWCTEGIWESLEGVVDVQSGFVGGTYPKSPSYANHGDYAEGNRIVYNPEKITYKQLVKAYFEGHSFGMSPDKGQSYRAIAFYDGKKQERILRNIFDKVMYVRMSKGAHFEQEIKSIDDVKWTAGPEDHQDYTRRLENGEAVPNPRYGKRESIPRRDRALELITASKKITLTHAQNYIMVQGGTERPFSSPLLKEKRSGVYVSAATGDILFLSKNKFRSGTGWPSFDIASENVSLGTSEQGGHEVIEKSTGYHLGHLFTGEHMTSNNARYCINGDALIFIPD